MHVRRHTESKKVTTGKAIAIDVFIDGMKEVYEQQSFKAVKGKIISSRLEKYIYKSIQNYSVREAIELVLYAREGNTENLCELLESIRDHFKVRTAEIERHLRKQFIHWEVNMVIGVLFMVFCLLLVEVLNKFSAINILKIIREGLLIASWVALWEPVTYMLFGWRSLNKKKLYYKKICRMPIRIGRAQRKSS